VLGAIAVAFTPEILRNPGIAGWLFYIGVVVLLVTVLRRWRMVAAVLAGVVVLGYLVRFLSLAIWDETILGAANDTFLSGILDGWLLILGPASDVVSNYAFVLALAGVLAVTVARGWRRGALLVPTIYLAILVWENKLSLQDSVTRQLLFGAVLVVMMAVRPEGILGTRRVEIT
jgi:ABC-type branched-subunit amino acid transport system permease subunit